MNTHGRSHLSVVMTVVLALPTSSGCAQLKALRTENADLKSANAKLGAERDCYDHERKKLAGDVAREKQRADDAAEAVAGALAEAAGERQRAGELEKQLTYTRAQIDRLDGQIQELMGALERAWSRKGRSRSLVDDLLKLKRGGADVDFKFDACNECEAAPAAAGGS